MDTEVAPHTRKRPLRNPRKKRRQFDEEADEREPVEGPGDDPKS